MRPSIISFALCLTWIGQRLVCFGQYTFGERFIGSGVSVDGVCDTWKGTERQWSHIDIIQRKKKRTTATGYFISHIYTIYLLP